MGECYYNNCNGRWHIRQCTIDKHKAEQQQKNECIQRICEIKQRQYTNMMNSTIQNLQQLENTNDETESYTEIETENELPSEIIESRMDCQTVFSDDNISNEISNDDKHTTSMNKRYDISDLKIDDGDDNNSSSISNLATVVQDLLYVKHKHRLTGRAMDDICRLVRSSHSNSDSIDIDEYPNSWKEMQNRLSTLLPKHIKVS